MCVRLCSLFWLLLSQDVLCVYIFFFSSRRRHTRCALVTGVQTCALPIWLGVDLRLWREQQRVVRLLAVGLLRHRMHVHLAVEHTVRRTEIGRASCRERVCQYV